jgi:hypothetical protein
MMLMKIINPLYDIAFKYLMENNRLARKVLSVILDEEIDELVIGQQETISPYHPLKLTLFRLDFKATLRKADGSRHTVLIELQKSKFPSDIQRFRKYLGATYMQQGHEAAQVQEPPQGMLPIIAIYILGYNLDDLPYLAITVNKEVIDSVNKQRVEVKSFFIEHLTHRAHIIQVLRLPQQRLTRLEQFLSLFNQAWCTHENIVLDLQEVPDEFADIAQYLQGPLMDEKFRRNMLAEQELDSVFGPQLAKLEQAEQKLQQAEKEKKEAIEKREEAEGKRKEAEQRTITLIRKWIMSLKQQGLSPEEISRQTGIDKDELDTY